MTEISRIADLYEQTFEGEPYYGPSLLAILKPITFITALSQPARSAHSIWQLVLHLTAELEYACAVLEGDAGPWVEGETTWPGIDDTSEAAWQRAVERLKEAHGSLVRAIRRLDDGVLDQDPIRVRGPYYLMLHGTLQHTIFHSGQISLLIGQISEGERGT